MKIKRIIGAILMLGLVGCGNIVLFAQTPEASSTATPLPSSPVQAGERNPDEPVFVSGTIPFTSPFFLSSFQEPFVLLEDEAGYVNHDREFLFRPEGQAIGPVELQDDTTASFSLSLPAVPQGTFVDVDNNGTEDTGVQVFAVAYWANTWGGPFLERRDGAGWSTAYTSAEIDPTQDDAIVGGTLLVWSPDDKQSFPTDLGEDGILFTEDDPSSPIPAGYNIVDMGQSPFRIYKQAEITLTLLEGAGAVNDYSSLSYSEAFDELYDKMSKEYPFTQDKNIDWEGLYDEYKPQIDAANSPEDFYTTMQDFVFEIPDGHIGGLFNRDVFFSRYGGGYGLVLAELTDKRVLVTRVIDDSPAAGAGISVGAEIITWDGQPTSAVIDTLDPKAFSSYGTPQARRLDQVLYLARVPQGQKVDINYQNPGEGPQTITLTASDELESLTSVLFPTEAALSLPVEGKVLPSGLGYIKINSFLDDVNLTARLWEHYVSQMIDSEVPGLIIDVRTNGGGDLGLAQNMAAYFFDEEIEIGRRSRYNEATGKFEYDPVINRMLPGPKLYEGPIAVLVSANCVSACEGFAYTMQIGGRSIVVGHTATAGAFGDVGLGQFSLPDGQSLQFPTGRPETIDGKLWIEGTGVIPDITVPITEDSALGRLDEVLEAAVKAILEKLQ